MKKAACTVKIICLCLLRSPRSVYLFCCFVYKFIYTESYVYMKSLLSRCIVSLKQHLLARFSCGVYAQIEIRVACKNSLTLWTWLLNVVLYVLIRCMRCSKSVQDSYCVSFHYHISQPANFSFCRCSQCTFKTRPM